MPSPHGSDGSDEQDGRDVLERDTAVNGSPPAGEASDHRKPAAQPVEGAEDTPPPGPGSSQR